MSTPHLQPVDPQRPTALGALVSILLRTGWREVTPADPYLAGSDAVVLEPIRPAGATGHTPARIATAGQVIGLVTFDWWGAELDRCSWGYITPHNLERALDYMQTAYTEAMAS